MYSTDYTGDVSTATWISMKENLIPNGQVGVGASKMLSISATTDLVAPSVVIAVRT
mgnify:FL=1